MKQIALTLLLLVTLVLPTTAQEEPALPEERLEEIETTHTSRSPYQFGPDVITPQQYRSLYTTGPLAHKLGSIGVIYGATTLALSTSLYIQTFGLDGHKRDDVEGIDEGGGMVAVFVMLGWISGGLSLATALPIYLWGRHLNMQTDGSTFAVENEPLGWHGMVDLGVGLSRISYVDFIYGKHCSQQFFWGFGVGYHQDLYSSISNFYFPVYGNLRWQFSNSRISPYIGARAGLSLPYLAPYSAIDWGVRVRCKESENLWWYSVGLSQFAGEGSLTFRIARMF